MIKKLQIKLISISMASLTLVLIVVFGIANMQNYKKITESADEILDILAENDGDFPDSLEVELEFNSYSSEEIPYESRYFSVLFESDGTISSADVGQIAAIDEATAIDYAEQIIEDGKIRGFIDEYRYLVYTTDDNIRIIFLDCGRLLYSFYSNVEATAIVALAGLAAVFALIFILSKRIIRPIIESYEKQRRFITDAGHEIKTPLSIINADAELLSMDMGSDNEWLCDIRGQVEKLNSLTENLIYLSRLQEADEHYQFIDLPISDIAQEAAQSFSSLALTKNIDFKIDIKPMLTLKGDERSLRRLIGILIENAVKYSPEGGTINFRLYGSSKNVGLSVENPAYLSKKDLKGIFERFYRTDRSRNSQTGGYGIGLSIAKAIVEAHKGRIWAQNKGENSLLITALFPA